ncbi:oxidoreductase [Vibrio sp. VB16]|uniref:oxidoreductase n=1 Tax=Vibrio sp. VB16 TaxID=2785746 RepID=UPI0018A11F12|nr:FAD-dependent oxidoreductase [Vibrio sp. VB16]UGA53662.1 FAD-dependent oxidoreductase [Vibrio sp. VB16]
MNRKLFTPFTINKLELKNRIIMTGMHLGYSFDKEIEFFKARAKGGAAAIITIAGVNEEGTMINMPLIDESIMDNFNKLSNGIHENGSKVIVQLFHAGRNGQVGLMKDRTKAPVAPSSVPSPIFKSVPKVMTIEDINRTINDFGSAATRCKEAGIDGIEINCSAGYLLSEFLSPLTNLRTDEYGKTLKNRMKFPTEVIKKVRESVGKDYPVILRISGSDMLGGYGIKEMQTFVSSLENGLINAVNVTGGWHESRVPQISSQVPEGGYSFFAGAIKNVVDIPVIVCNRINNGEIAEEILQKGLGDFVGCARAFLSDPQFANKVKTNTPYRRCIGCNKACIERVFQLKNASCIWNPENGREGIERPKVDKQKVLVIGAGPAGMEVAKHSAKLGHDVTICTEDSEVGGLLHIAGAPPRKDAILENINTMHYEIKQLGVKIVVNTTVDPGFIKDFAPDKTFVATGSLPVVPSIEGINEDNVYLADDVLHGDPQLLTKLRKGKTCIIGGGVVGLETAHYLAESGLANTLETFNFLEHYVPKELQREIYKSMDITVVEMQGKAGTDLGALRLFMLGELKQLGVKILTRTKVQSISSHGLTYTNEEDTITQPVNNIVLAMGYKSNGKQLIEFLEQNNYSYDIIGDAKKPGNIENATIDAYRAALNI